MKKFSEDLDTAVITTKYVLENISPILYVFHFEDGFWQFSGLEDNLIDSDYKVISLDEVIKLDASVLDVANLPYKKMAYRKDIFSKWDISDIDK